MIVVEYREAAYDKAFELLDEVKHYGKKTKLAVCQLEDALYDCYEDDKNGYEDREEEYDPEEMEEYESQDVNYRSTSNMGSRSDYRMRHGENDRTYTITRHGNRGGMRMRSMRSRR